MDSLEVLVLVLTVHILRRIGLRHMDVIGLHIVVRRLPNGQLSWATLLYMLLRVLEIVLVLVSILRQNGLRRVVVIWLDARERLINVAREPAPHAPARRDAGHAGFSAGHTVWGRAKHLPSRHRRVPHNDDKTTVEAVPVVETDGTVAAPDEHTQQQWHEDEEDEEDWLKRLYLQRYRHLADVQRCSSQRLHWWISNFMK